MAIDIEATEDWETYWDGTGDIATTNGQAQIAQNVLIRIREEVDLSAPAPTPSAIETQRADILQSVRDNEGTEPPYSVTVVESPLDSTATDEVLSVSYEIQTSRITLTVDTE